MKYIKACKDQGCFICRACRGRQDRANLLVRRGDTCVVILNRFPYNGGHLLVAPKRHVADLQGLNAAERVELTELTIAAVEALQALMQPQGFNIGLNLGAAAGAGLKDHLHQHIVPRWTGDTNFMPTLAAIKVMPQTLDDLWEQLRAHWNRKRES